MEGVEASSDHSGELFPKFTDGSCCFCTLLGVRSEVLDSSRRGIPNDPATGSCFSVIQVELVDKSYFLLVHVLALLVHVLDASLVFRMEAAGDGVLGFPPYTSS